MERYWLVTDERGVVHSIHTFPASAHATIKWLTSHHPRFYADWFVKEIRRERLKEEIGL